MTPEQRYKRFDAANAVLSEEMEIIRAAMKRMEKAAAEYEFESLRKRYHEFRLATNLMTSEVQKHLYAKVSFR